MTDPEKKPKYDFSSAFKPDESLLKQEEILPKKQKYDFSSAFKPIDNSYKPTSPKSYGDSFIANFGEGFVRSGKGGLVAGGAYLAGEAGKLVSDDWSREVQNWAKEYAKDVPDPDGSAGQWIGSLVPSIIPSALAIGAAAAAPFTAGASLVAAGSIGALVAASSGSGMMEYEDYKKEKGQEVNTLEKLAVGTAYGAAEYAFERLALGRMLPEGFQKKFIGNPEKAVEAGKEILATFAKNNPSTMKKVLGNIAKNSQTEGLTEAATEITQAFVQDLYKDDPDKTTFLDKILQAGEAYAGGMLMGAGLGPLSYGAQNAANKKRRQEQGKVVMAEYKGQSVELIAAKETKGQEVYVAMRPDNTTIEIPKSEIGKQYAFSYEQFQNIIRGKADETKVLTENRLTEAQQKREATEQIIRTTYEPNAFEAEGRKIFATARYKGKEIIIRGKIAGTKNQYAYVWPENPTGAAQSIDLADIDLDENGNSTYQIRDLDETISEVVGPPIDFNKETERVPHVGKVLSIEGQQLKVTAYDPKTHTATIETGIEGQDDYDVVSLSGSELDRVLDIAEPDPTETAMLDVLDEKETNFDDDGQITPEQLKTTTVDLDVAGNSYPATRNEDGSFELSFTSSNRDKANALAKKVKAEYENDNFKVQVVNVSKPVDGIPTKNDFRIQIVPKNQRPTKKGTDLLDAEDVGAEPGSEIVEPETRPGSSETGQIQDVVAENTEVIPEKVGQIQDYGFDLFKAIDLNEKMTPEEKQEFNALLPGKLNDLFKNKSVPQEAFDYLKAKQDRLLEKDRQADVEREQRQKEFREAQQKRAEEKAPEVNVEEKKTKRVSREKLIKEIEPQTVREVVLLHFLSGGTIKTDDFRSETGLGRISMKTGKQVKSSQGFGATWMQSKTGPSMDALIGKVKEIMDPTGERDMDEQDIRNEIIDVIANTTNKAQLEDELRDSYEFDGRIVSPAEKLELERNRKIEEMSPEDLASLEAWEKIDSYFDEVYELTDEEAQRLLDEEKAFNEFYYDTTKEISGKVSEDIQGDNRGVGRREDQGVDQEDQAVEKPGVQQPSPNQEVDPDRGVERDGGKGDVADSKVKQVVEAPKVKPTTSQQHKESLDEFMSKHKAFKVVEDDGRDKVKMKTAIDSIVEFSSSLYEKGKKIIESANSKIENLQIGQTVKYNNYGRIEQGKITKINKNNQSKITSLNIDNTKIDINDVIPFDSLTYKDLRQTVANKRYYSLPIDQYTQNDINQINKEFNTAFNDSPVQEAPKAIRQLGTGANVYFETDKYRVNDTRSGKVILNVGGQKDVVPIANYEFDTPAEAVKVAQKLSEIYPNGVPDAVLIDKVVEDIKAQISLQNFDFNKLYADAAQDIEEQRETDSKKKEAHEAYVKSANLEFDLQIAENEKKIEDLQGRKYKSNDDVVYKGGDDVHGEAMSIGSINEAKRNKKIKGLLLDNESLRKAKEILSNYDYTRDGSVIENIKKDFQVEDYTMKGKKMSTVQQNILDDAYDKLIKKLNQDSPRFQKTPAAQTSLFGETQKGEPTKRDVLKTQLKKLGAELKRLQSLPVKTNITQVEIEWHKKEINRVNAAIDQTLSRDQATAGGEQQSLFQKVFDAMPVVTLDAIDPTNVATNTVMGPFNPQSKQRVEEVAKKFMEKWANKPDVVVYESLLDFAVAYPELYARDMYGTAGVMYKGKVHIIASNPKFRDINTLTAEVADTMAHEVFGHYGLRGMILETVGKDQAKFRQEFNSLMDDVLNSYAGSPRLDRLSIRYHNRPFSKLNKAEQREMAEEIIAHMAQTNENPSIMDRLVTLVRQIYRNLTGQYLKMNDAEIRSLIGNSRKFIEVGENNFVPRQSRMKVSDHMDISELRQQVEAYHGSPYSFDKFSLDKIGTGEGAQAFGWGLYFTDLKSIAEDYADRLSSIGEPVIDGKKIDDWFRENDLKAPYSSNYWMPELLAESKTKDEALSKIDVRIKSQEGKIDDYNDILDDNDATQNERSGARAALNNLETELQLSYDLYNAVFRAKTFEPTSTNRNLYKVSLHKGKTPDQYNWLEWDKPVSESVIKNVRDIAGAGLKPALKGKLTGDNLYKYISNYFNQNGDGSNPDKQASLFLLRAGIDGIKYPAESVARGATSDTARGFNYVVFDENAVSIEEAVRFQKAPSVESEAFKKWFGDSKVVDENGKPLVVYHASRQSFDQFKKGETQGAGGNLDGFFFTDNKQEVNLNYAGKRSNIYPVYLSFQNPLRKGVPRKDWSRYTLEQKYIQEAKSNGNDSLILDFIPDEDAKFKIKKSYFVAFEPTQIKSSTGNTGTFDQNNPDIRFQISDQNDLTPRFSDKGIWDYKIRIDKPINNMPVDSYEQIIPAYNQGDKLFIKRGSRGPVTVSSNNVTLLEKIKGSFHPDNTDGIRFQKPIEESKNLIALHNIRPDGLLNADKLGGLPMPSLAITRTDLQFDNFGDITMIADKSLVDPKVRGNKTFAADIYSPRYPSINYFPDIKELNQVFKEVREAIPTDDYRYDISTLAQTIRDEGTRYIQDNLLMRAAYVLEKGKKLPKMKELPKPKVDKSILDYVDSQQGYYDGYSARNDEQFIEIYKKVRAKEVQEMYKDDKKAQRLLLKDISNWEIPEVFEKIRKLKNGKTEYDHSEFRNKLIEETSNSTYRNWVQSKVSQLKIDEKIFKGFTNSGTRKYLPHTLENVMKSLKAESLRAGEGFMYGLGTVRAAYTPQFKSIKDIQKAKDRLVTKEQFEAIKTEIEKDFEAISESLSPFYKYQRMGMDTVANMLVDASRTGLVRELKEYGFEDVDESTINEIREFIEKARNMPTEYFESKPQRAVDLSEFKAAIVPKDVDKSVLEVLKRKGVKVVQYNNTKEDRQEKLNQLVQENEDLRFQIIGEVGAQNLPTVRQNLQVARDMESAGKKPKEIYLATGWEKSKDKWKYDLPDASLKLPFDQLTKNSYTLGELLDGELFKAYPEIAKTKVQIEDDTKGMHAWFDKQIHIKRPNKQEYDTVKPSEPTQTRDGGKRPVNRPFNFRSSLIHEAQHAIQKIEGFDTGTNPSAVWQRLIKDKVEEFKQKNWYQHLPIEAQESLAENEVSDEYLNSGLAYLRKAGEVEARNAETRATMSPQDRQRSMISETEDVAEESKIYFEEQPGSDQPRFQKAPPTNSKEFKEWFGDSKVVNPDGSPMVVYHGTTSKEEFDIKEGSFRYNGFYTTAFPDYANKFAESGSVMPLYVKVENPLIIDMEETNFGIRGGFIIENKLFPSYRELSKDEIDFLKNKGYDGIIVNVPSSITKTKYKDGIQEKFEVVTFSPTQVKSATGNIGSYDPTNPDIRFQKNPSDNFYSNSLRAIANIGQPRATKEQWTKMLLNNGASEAELKWIGFDDFLKDNPKPTKEQVYDFIESNQIEIVEVVKGETKTFGLKEAQEYYKQGKKVYGINNQEQYLVDPKSDNNGWYNTTRFALEEDLSISEPKYNRSPLVLPGGENYREVLLTMPTDAKTEKSKLEERYTNLINQIGGMTINDPSINKLIEERNKIKLELDKYGPRGITEGRTDQYKSSHWDEPNVLAHIRMNDRVVDGQKVLFVEELQSDWQSEGRKKGWKSDMEAVRDRIAEIEKRREELRKTTVEINNILDFVTDMTQKYGDFKPYLLSEAEKSQYETLKSKKAEAKSSPEFIAKQKEDKELSDELRDLNKISYSIPDMPFPQTSQWVNLALRRVIRMAAEEGYDRVAWVNGEQSADRYDLSKSVDELYWNPNSEILYAYKNKAKIIEKQVSKEELPDTIGKEATEKLLSSPKKGKQHELKGEQLKIGGEGMKAFYDSIVPAQVKKVLSKIDKSVKVEAIDLTTNKIEFVESYGKKLPISDEFSQSKQLSFEISPLIKQTAIQEGMPLFQKVDKVEEEPAIQIQKFDRMREAVQDGMIYVKRLIEAKDAEFEDKVNAYRFENLSKGIVNELLDQFKIKFRNPLINQVKLINDKFGATYEETSRYLKAKHIVTDNIEAGGIPIEEANEIVKAYKKKVGYEAIEELEKQVKAINSFILERRVSTGLVSAEEHNEINNMFKFYVPLRGFMEADDTTVFTKEVARKGRSTESGDPMAYLFTMAQTAIEKGQKNLVKQRLFEFTKQFPDSRMYAIRSVWYVNYGDGNWETMTSRPPQEIFDKYEVKRNVPIDDMSEAQFANFRAKNTFNEQTVSVMIGGKQFVMEFYGEGAKVARAIKSMDMDKSNAVIKVLGSYTRTLTKFYTQYSPEFAFRNLVRDMTTGLINVKNDMGTAAVGRVLKNIPSAMNTIRKFEFGQEGKEVNDKDAAIYKAYKENGAMTGYSDLKEVKDYQKEFENAIEGLKGNQIRWTLNQLSKLLKPLDQLNRVFENTVRFSAFKMLVEQEAASRGMGVQDFLKLKQGLEQPAAYAKDLTVNFNRKGNWSNTIGSIYLFFNASIQGNERLLRPFGFGKQNLSREERQVRNRAYQSLFALGAIGAAMSLINRAMGGEDEDDEFFYDKLSTFERTHHLMIPNFISEKQGDFFKIPLPYGYNTFFVGPELIIRGLMGKETALESALNLLEISTESFSPLGSPMENVTPAEALLEYASPTIAKPVVQWTMNKNFAGMPIYKEGYPGTTPRPNSQMHYKSVNPLFKALTDELNKLSGGDEEQGGYIDINPEMIEHVVGSYGGGVYQFGINTSTTMLSALAGKNPVTDDDLKRKIPFVRNYNTQPSPQYNRSRFYDQVKQVEAAEDIYRRYIKSGDISKAKKYSKENIELLKLSGAAKSLNKKAKDLTEARKAMEAKGTSPERVDAQLDKIYMQMNQLYNREKKPNLIQELLSN